MAEPWSVEEELLNERSPFQVFQRPKDPFARLPGDESDLDTITGHLPEGMRRHPDAPREGGTKSIPSRMLEWLSGFIPHGGLKADGSAKLGDIADKHYDEVAKTAMAPLPEGRSPLQEAIARAEALKGKTPPGMATFARYGPKGLANIGFTDIPRGMLDSTAGWANWRNKGLGEFDPLEVLMNPQTVGMIAGGKPLQRVIGRGEAASPAIMDPWATNKGEINPISIYDQVRASFDRGGDIGVPRPPATHNVPGDFVRPGSNFIMSGEETVAARRPGPQDAANEGNVGLVRKPIGWSLYSRADKRAAKFANLSEAERRARQEASARQQVETDFKKVVEGIPGVRIQPPKIGPEAGLSDAIQSRSTDSTYYQLRPERGFQQAVTVRQGTHPGRPITGRQRTQMDREFHAPNIMVDLSKPIGEGPSRWQETSGGVPYLKGDKLDPEVLNKTLSNLFMKGDWLVGPEYRAHGIIPEQPPKHTTSPRAAEYDPFKDTHRNPRLSSTVGELWARGDKRSAIAATVDTKKFETPREKAEKAYDAGPYEVPVNELSPLEGTPYSADLKYPPLPKKTKGTGKITDYVIAPGSQALKFDQAWLDPRNTERPLLPDDARAQGRPELLQQAMEKFYAEPDYSGAGRPGAEALAKRKRDPVASMNYWQAQQRFKTSDDGGTLHAKGDRSLALVGGEAKFREVWDKHKGLQKTIAHELGISPSEVGVLKHKLGIDAPKNNAMRKVPDAAALLELYRKHDGNMAAMAREVGVHKSNMGENVRKHKLPFRDAWERHGGKQAKVAEELGVSQQSVSKWAREQGLEANPTGTRVPADRVMEALQRHGGNKSAAARELGIDWNAVHRRSQQMAEREAASQKTGVEAEMARRPGGLQRELYDPEKGPAEWGVKKPGFWGDEGSGTLYAGGNKMPFRRFGYDPERKAEGKPGDAGKLSEEQKAADRRRRENWTAARREQQSQAQRMGRTQKEGAEVDVSASRRTREALDTEAVLRLMRKLRGDQ